MNDNQIQPGQTYTPGGQMTPPPPQTSAPPVDTVTPSPQPAAPEAMPPQPAAPVAPPAMPPTMPPASQATPRQDEPTANVDHTALEHAKESQQANPNEQQNLEPEEVLFSWNAPEFTYISKPAGWYGILALVCLVLCGGLIYFRQWVAVAMVLVMGLAMAVVGSRRPRNLNYTVTNYGIYVGEKAYPFDDFRAHYEGNDYGQKVLELVPTKRFSPMVSVPVLPQNHDAIFEAIGAVLPKTEPTNNPIDKLFTFFRF